MSTDEDKHSDGEKITSPMDISPTTNAEQETEHNSTNSQLAMQGHLSLSRASGSLSQSGFQRISSSSVAAKSVAISSISPHTRVDHREHKNEDATAYYATDDASSSSNDSSVESAQPSARETTSAERNRLQEDSQRREGYSVYLDENSDLPEPLQATEPADNATDEMVSINEYTSESLTSMYYLLVCKRNYVSAASISTDTMHQPNASDPRHQPVTEKSADVSEDLFSMDEDEEDISSEDSKNDDSSLTAFTARLSLNFDKKKSTVQCQPNQCIATGETVRAAKQQKMTTEGTIGNQILSKPAIIDVADQHRDPIGVLADTTHSPILNKSVIKGSKFF